MSQFELVTSQDRLDAFCQQAQPQPHLFLDTEFVRTRTLRPKLGLIQAYDGISVVLIDPTVGLDLSEFWQLLSHQHIIKVLHSCSEDLEVFKFDAGILPSPLFDTQVAAAILGNGPSMGYANLVRQLLNVELDKGETRTDWLARPLSDKQLSYAANDVIYLKDIYIQLQQQLATKGIEGYVLQEGELMIAKRKIDKPYNEIYQDVKNAWRLEPRELAVLQQLAAWRQQEAERRDLALNFVLKEPNMFTIAKHQPDNLKQLRLLPGILPQEVRYHGNAIIENVAIGLDIPAEQMPKKLVRLVDFERYKGTYRDLRGLLEQAANAHQIPVEAIASKRQLNQLLSWQWKRTEQDKAQSLKPDLLQGWRYELVGQKMLALLEK